ncbi:uncharacterized protein ATC70_001671 [Mucor velutinosus]|uniref:ribonuclease T2 n=1 Tax=Mucor velutinosus TaxID=708070 RepID=A0AAN7DKZ3_9FUNG|nr:hypothetical protein ATC70_001671 [Mucor velutinosus]
MKFMLPLLVLLGLSSAQITANQLDALDAPNYFNASVVSCHWSGAVDACCSPKYGLRVFALQWSPGWGPADEFTIRGLFSDTCDSHNVPDHGYDKSRNSNQAATIVQNMNETVYNRMSTFWPSNKGNNNQFWSHEWSKHGTCVSTLHPTCYGSYQQYQNVIEYFQQTLDLRDKFDIFGALNLNGVSPGSTHNVETIRDAIKKVYGANVKLDCSGGALIDVSLNFYVKGRSDYMITDVLQPGNCRGAVFFPKK